MKILWMSNAPWVGTGYGVQTLHAIQALRDRGHEVEVFAFYGLEGGVIEWEGFKVWPHTDFDSFGNDVIRLHLKHSEADVVVTLLDPFVLDMSIWGDLPVPWIAWVPIDADNIGHPTLERLKLINYPIAMSNHGAQQIEAAGVPVAETIYHSVDVDEFYELEIEERMANRRSLFGIEDNVFLAGMVMANKGDRKQFAKHFEGFRLFLDQHPDIEARLFLHTNPTNKMGGWDINRLAKKFGLDHMVYHAEEYPTTVVYVTNEIMRKLYNCMDVLLHCSAGEGFGVPIIEAQACGVPVIAHNVTSMSELVWNGYLVDPSEKYLAMHEGFQYLPDVQQIADRLHDVYLRGNSETHRAVGRQSVINNCSRQVIGDKWDEVIREVEERERARADAGEAQSEPGAEGSDARESELAG